MMKRHGGGNRESKKSDVPLMKTVEGATSKFSHLKGEKKERSKGRAQTVGIDLGKRSCFE